MQTPKTSKPGITTPKSGSKMLFSKESVKKEIQKEELPPSPSNKRTQSSYGKRTEAKGKVMILF